MNKNTVKLQGSMHICQYINTSAKEVNVRVTLTTSFALLILSGPCWPSADVLIDECISGDVALTVAIQGLHIPLDEIGRSVADSGTKRNDCLFHCPLAHGQLASH